MTRLDRTTARRRLAPFKVNDEICRSGKYGPAPKSGGGTDDSYSSQARVADDEVEWQMSLVVSGGKCSLLPSSSVVLIFDGPLDMPNRSDWDTSR